MQKINTILTKFPELEGKLLLNVNKPEVAEKNNAPAEIKAESEGGDEN